MILGSWEHEVWKAQQIEKQRAYEQRRAEWLKANGVPQNQAWGPKQ